MPETFGERLKRIRERKGLTQVQLGKITGIAYQQISKYEKGANNPSILVVEWLCKALGVSATELLGY